MVIIREKDSSPCGISLRLKNWISVESVFHGASPVKYRHGCDTDTLAVRIFHGASRKDAKGAKFGKNRKLFFFASLASFD